MCISRGDGPIDRQQTTDKQTKKETRTRKVGWNANGRNGVLDCWREGQILDQGRNGDGWNDCTLLLCYTMKKRLHEFVDWSIDRLTHPCDSKTSWGQATYRVEAWIEARVPFRKILPLANQGSMFYFIIQWIEPKRKERDRNQGERGKSSVDESSEQQRRVRNDGNTVDDCNRNRFEEKAYQASRMRFRQQCEKSKRCKQNNRAARHCHGNRYPWNWLWIASKRPPKTVTMANESNTRVPVSQKVHRK